MPESLVGGQLTEAVEVYIRVIQHRHNHRTHTQNRNKNCKTITTRVKQTIKQYQYKTLIFILIRRDNENVMVLRTQNTEFEVGK